jgi:hypothetical protein
LHLFIAGIIQTGGETFLQAKGNPAGGRQNWKRSDADANGWFTLEDPMSGLVLSANSSLKNPTIEGRYMQQILLLINRKSVIFFFHIRSS